MAVGVCYFHSGQHLYFSDRTISLNHMINYIIASFTKLDVNVNVDHSTNIGEVVYTLMNGNDTRRTEIDATISIVKIELETKQLRNANV